MSSIASSDLLYTGSNDGTISVFKNTEKIGEIKGHNLAVWCLKVDEDNLYSAGSDGQLKV